MKNQSSFPCSNQGFSFKLRLEKLPVLQDTILVYKNSNQGFKHTLTILEKQRFI